MSIPAQKHEKELSVLGKESVTPNEALELTNRSPKGAWEHEGYSRVFMCVPHLPSTSLTA